MPDLSGLPPWAIMVFLAAAGLGFIVIRSGILDGIKKPAADRSNTGEIVALTVDSRAIDQLAGELAGLIVVLTEIKAQFQRYISDKEQERADRDLDEEVSRRVTEELDRRERAKRTPRQS